MECRDITEHQFQLILAELQFTTRKDYAVEAVAGDHAVYGTTVLLRDGSRCMALIANPTGFDRFLAEQAFVANGNNVRVAGQG